MPKKQKSRNKTVNISKWLWKILLIVIILITAYLLLRPGLINKSYYSTDKNTAEANLKDTINDLKLSGFSVYSSVRDIGCDSRNSVGLEEYIHCELIGEIYYKTQGESKAELDDFNKKLESEGWTSSQYSNSSSENVERSVAASRGEGSGSRPYRNDDNHLRLVLYFEQFNEENTYIDSYHIKELIEDQAITRPVNGESIYGAYITKTYWTCRSKYLFLTLCPEPPSKPE